MEYSGLIQKYKINRPLTEEERAQQLKQKERLEIEPHYHLAVTRINSTYLECVDKYYEWKGSLSFWMLAVLFVITSAQVAFVFIVLTRDPADAYVDVTKDWLVVGFISLLLTPLFWLSIWALRKEAFAYTHYPIRLHRKDRKVYVFRLDGTVLVAPWDGLFFTLGRGNRRYGYQNWDIRGHVLAADGLTVKETFAFAMDWEEIKDIHRHWEYLRRYMEDGPQTLLEYTPVYLPIVDRYETYSFGFFRLVFNFPGLILAWLLAPVFFLFSLGRYFAMHTSEIPVWPAKIEAACAIEAGDPYERDARNNPEKFWKST